MSFQKARDNLHWKGDNATPKASANYMAKNIPKPSDGRCSVCGIANKRLYLYNDTKVYNRDSKNYQWRRSRNTCGKPIERGALVPATIA